jgi:hypothetical protein
VQDDLEVSQFFVAEDVPKQVAGEDGTAGTENTVLAMGPTIEPGVGPGIVPASTHLP